MPRAGFEITVPLIERPKTFHVLDRVAAVTGSNDSVNMKCEMLTQLSSSLLEP
jgi:hypothetical protein